ncbi:hypothetical protein ACFFQF_04375 [Haladaptatus pallidirubidus]|uniref:hypothetical protein n=1 Tax=Haladaptatus pallidirubidus TaxID=1008152 RepID=UPI0035ECBF1F
MARDCSTTVGEREISDSSVNRRSYLKLTGSTALALTGAGLLSNGAAAAEYETIEVPAGSREQFQVGSGETFENKLIDISATGADARIVASGSDWTIRNVGFKGAADMSGPHSPGENQAATPTSSPPPEPAPSNTSTSATAFPATWFEKAQSASPVPTRATST